MQNCLAIRLTPDILQDNAHTVCSDKSSWHFVKSHLLERQEKELTFEKTQVIFDSSASQWVFSLLHLMVTNTKERSPSSIIPHRKGTQVSSLFEVTRFSAA